MAAQTLLGHLMKEQDLTQIKLARGLGMNQGKVSQLINNKSKPSKGDAAKLEKFFGIRIESLLSPMEADNHE